MFSKPHTEYLIVDKIIKDLNLTDIMTDDFFRNKEKELEWLNSGRVTTDTVHRRFHKPKPESDSKREPNNGFDGREEYFCFECRFGIISTVGIKNLKEHFDSIQHKNFEKCVYCLRPAYFYKYKGNIEIYHSC